MILALALAAALNPWAELAVRDLEAMHAQIEANHPGPADALNPGFREWLDKGYEQALAKAREAKTFGGFAYAIRYYGAGFRDGHLNSGVMLTPQELWWPRFLVRLRNDRYVVAAVADAKDASLPPVGAELVDCDGRSARTMVEEDLWPYAMGPKIESAWAGVAENLLLDRGNPWVPRAKTCRFRVGDETKSMAIRYRRTNDEGIRNVAKTAVATLEPLPAVRRVGDGLWFSIPSFVGADEATASRLREIVEAASHARDDAAFVVFDVRGNGGGNSAWGDDILKALYGEEFLRATVFPRFDRQYVEWRVSKDNLAHVRGIVEDVKAQQGADSENAKYFQRVADGMEKALGEGRALFRLMDDDDEEGRTEARPTLVFKGKVVLLTDRKCASACLDFADRVRLLPAAQHLGLATSADSVYMEVRPADLPSGVGRLGLPVKVYRDRPRGHNEPYVPQVTYEGDINDTAAVEKWVLAMLPM